MIERDLMTENLLLGSPKLEPQAVASRGKEPSVSENDRARRRVLDEVEVAVEIRVGHVRARGALWRPAAIERADSSMQPMPEAFIASS